MKKAYSSPKSERISLYIESPILSASSTTIDKSEGSISGEGDIRSNRFGWNSSNWSGTAGDED